MAGILVAVMVSWMGLRIGIDSLSQLTDYSDYSVVSAAEEIAQVMSS